MVNKYIYIDESGDLGLSEMSSNVLVISALIADDPRKLDRVIKNARRHKFSKELRKAKEFVKGHLVLELEDSRSVAGFYGSQELLEKRVDNPEEVISKIEEITAEEIQEVAKPFFANDQLNLAVIGDFNDGQKFEKLLTS